MNDAAVGALLGMLSGLATLPANIAALVALLKEAREHKREIQPAELAALRLDDDELDRQLQAAIDTTGSNE